MPIVEAVGSASFSPNKGGAKMSKLIEQAMSNAVHAALTEGVSIHDSETIRARMLAAREAVKATHGVR